MERSLVVFRSLHFDAEFEIRKAHAIAVHERPAAGDGGAVDRRAIDAAAIFHVTSRR